MADLNQLLDAIAAHYWVLVAALTIGFAVRIWKSPLFAPWTDKIPKQYRPFVALALGIVASVLEAVLAGTAWPEAALGGLIGAVLAIAGHQTLIEGLRGGRELFEDRPSKTGGGGKLSTVGIVLAVVGLAGCASALDAAAHTTNAGRATLKAARADILVRYRAEQEQAARAVESKADKQRAVQAVRRAYAPILAAYEAARSGWLTAVAAVRAAQAVEAAGGEVALADVIAVVAALERAVAKVVALNDALDEPEPMVMPLGLQPAPSSPGVSP